MAQVTIYMNNELEEKVKDIASTLNLSISKFISTILEKNLKNSWNENTHQLVGSWNDFPTLEEIRENQGKDIEREEF